jgi:hypothetical protein
MKKITIELNTKSIKKAQKHLLDLENQIPKMQQKFLMAVANWVTNRANLYISNSDIGNFVKSDIIVGWEYEPTANGVKIINRTQKAVFVEFGVGIVGQSEAHPNASAEGYEYNMDSYHKDRKGTGTWLFQSSLIELDLPLKNVELAYNESGNEYAIVTRGAKGVWYAYNAIVDAQMELAKSGGGEIGKIWEDIKARYIK